MEALQCDQRPCNKDLSESGKTLESPLVFEHVLERALSIKENKIRMHRDKYRRHVKFISILWLSLVHDPHFLGTIWIVNSMYLIYHVLLLKGSMDDQRRVNSLIKNSTSSKTLGKSVSKRDNPNSHYMPRLANTKQGPYSILVAK